MIFQQNISKLRKEQMVTYKIIYDITLDAYNWYNSINNFGSARKLKTEEDKKIAKQITGLSFAEARQILVSFLERRNQEIEMTPQKFYEIMNNQLKEKFDTAIEKLERVTGHALAVKDCAKNRSKEIKKITEVDLSELSSDESLIFLITTFPAMIVYYEEGVIYTYAKIDNELWGMPLDGILHELMHFQTDYYYRQNPKSPVSKLSEDDYFILKESLTVLLDESWEPIITLPDCSYPEYQSIRDQLLDFYHQHQDFDKLMEFGAHIFLKK